MADYIYLLENRLSAAQRSALRTVRELARSKNLTVFLVGGAVRDLTSGSPVRDLDVVVQGNALKLKADLEKAGAVITGEIAPAQCLFADSPGSVRMEIGSTLSVTWPKPGKPVYKPATILEDLRRRDFTANAMALSLNEGSYGLLMDPLNGIADIENRELRLVSNYGFIEDPVRMVRAARFMARLGWSLDEKTQQRYETGKAEDFIAALSDQQRGYELEEIVHEEDPYRILSRLEAEGWLAFLAPYWTSAKADVPALEHLREVQTQFQLQGIHPDASAANFPLLTAKLSAKDVAALKSSFVRPGFVKEIESLDQRAKDLVNLLTGKSATLPSQTWQIIASAPPEVVLWVAFSAKSPAVQAKFKNFFSVWPQARQRIPHALLQEMRIVPELPVYEEVLSKLFFELMDDKLQTSEELKAFLEPYSPPAPPPPVSTRRPRAGKKEGKGKGRAKKALAIDLDDESEDDGDGELPDEIEDVLPDVLDDVLDEPAEADIADEPEANDDSAGDLESEPDSGDLPDEAPPVKAAGRASIKAAPSAKATTPVAPAPAPSQSVAKTAPEKTAPAKSIPAKSAPASPAPTKKLAAQKKPAAQPAKAAVAPPSPRRPLASSKPSQAAPSTKLAVKAAPGKPPLKPVLPAKAVGKQARSASNLIVDKAPAKKPAPAKIPTDKQSSSPNSASKKAVPAKKRH
jgi:tRNA nucleotidyltransferase/poly(A) polymerase